MPTYEYQCEGQCQKRFELKHSMKQEFKKCFECGGSLKRLISKPRYIFTDNKMPIDSNIRTEDEIIWRSPT